MRVCLYTSYYPPRVGGAERQASLLAAGLAQGGDEVTVLTRHLPGSPAHEVRDGVHVHRVVRPGRRGALFGAGLLLTLFAFFASRRRRFDVVHVTGIHLGTYVPCRLRRRHGFRVVLRPMGPGPQGDLATLGAQRLWPVWPRADAGTRRHILATIRDADAFVALSRELRDELAAAGFPPQRIVRINNGVPVPDAPREPAAVRAARQALGLSGGPVLLYVGRLHARKGVDDLLRSLPALAPRHPALTLLVLGEGPHEAVLKELAAELGLTQRVRFLGFQDPAPALQAADLFVLPSWAEGTSNALLEAMAAGLPCVATRVSGNTELIEDGDTGLLVEPGEPSALAAAVGRLLEEADIRTAIGRRARQRVQAAYSLTRMVAEYRGLFAQLAADGTIPARLCARVERAS